MRNPVRNLLFSLAAAAAAGGFPGALARPSGGEAPEWLRKQMPLPLAVKSVEDLKIKALAERHYLIFNLLGGGKLAWDAGDPAQAAARWEELLRLPDLEPELVEVIGALAAKARARAGGKPEEPTVAATPDVPKTEDEKKVEPAKPTTATVSGTVSGGESGPGGAVITLRATDGRRLIVRPVRGKVMVQKGKQFIPHVLAVPVGSTVTFRNSDEIFHNVFSLSSSKQLDTGFLQLGKSADILFDKPGVVELLCNIHTTMLAYVVVVDTPHYALAGPGGSFTIKNVPLGEYAVEVWHESAATPSKEKLTLRERGARLSLFVGSDKKPNPSPPDKYGKPRQQHLGY